MNRQLEDLIRQYGMCCTDREKAVLEAEMWKVHSSSGEYIKDKATRGIECISSFLSVPPRAIRIRNYIFRAGPSASALWTLLESGASLGKVFRIYRRARHATGPGKGLEQSITESINQDNSEEKVVPRLSKKSSRPVKVSNHAVWRKIRQILQSEISKQIDGISDSDKERIYRDFKIDMKIAFDSAQHRIRKARTFSSAELEIRKLTKREVIDACHILGMDPPKTALVSVNLDEARKLRGKLASNYHPDKHPDDPALRTKYLEIIQAYDLLRTHNEKLESI